MKPNIILMNFTHVYEQERFINDIHFQWIDCTDLTEPTATVMQKQPKSLDKEWPPTYLKEYISLIPVTIIISVNFGRIK